MPQLDLRTKTALIVDDNRNRSTLLRRVLRELGLTRVNEVPDVADGAAGLQATWVDIAFVEKDLAFLDGYQFARMVRFDPLTQNPFLPVVLLCSTVDRSSILRAINTGIDAVMAKPLTHGEVNSKVGQLLGRPLTYIRTGSGYFGPDRRRRPDPGYGGHERRKVDEAIRLGPGAEFVRQDTWRREPRHAETAAPRPMTVDIDDIAAAAPAGKRSFAQVL